MAALPRINPFPALLWDAVFFAVEAIKAPRGQSARAARASTMHALSALNAAANALLLQEEEPEFVAGNLVTRFQRVAELLADRPADPNDLALLAELDDVSGILFNPLPAQAHPFGKSTRQIEFERTALLRFNRECSGWTADYACAVLAHMLGILERFLLRTLGWGRDRTEILFGHQLFHEDGCNAAVDGAVIEQIREGLTTIRTDGPVMSILTSVRWKLRPEDFALRFL